MPSWVRFSVAVYLGLLLAGAVITPEPIAARGVQQPTAPLRLPWAAPSADAHHRAGLTPAQVGRQIKPVDARSTDPRRDTAKR